MPAVSVLLRLLLCLVLVANGLGVAQVATGMRLAHLAQAAAVVTGAGQGDCHEASPEVPEAASTKAHGALSAHADAGDADCCEDGACLCICMVPASLAVAVGLASAVAPADADAASGDVRHHVPPRLPHLIRPPIG